MSYIKAQEMRFLFFGTPRTTRKGFFNNDLKLTTQIFSILSIIFSLPTVITNFHFIDDKTIPIIYLIYTLIEFSGPILILMGTIYYDFSLCYTGTLIYSVFTILEMTVKIAYGLIVGLFILPFSLYPPIAALASIYLAVFFIFWSIFLGVRLYINYVFYIAKII